MKKIITTIVAVAMIFTLTGISAVFASSQPNETYYTTDDGGTRFTYFSSINTSFGINGGNANWRLSATKRSAYDYAMVTTSLIKKNSGVVATYSNTFYNKSISLSNSRALSTKGTYHVKFTIKCYKDGSLKETITVTTGSDSY